MCIKAKASASVKECLQEANAFYRIANDKYSGEAKFGLSDMLYPFVVNIAFSCELSLKAIMMLRSDDGAYEKGHCLEELFASLDEGDQRDIRNRCAEELNMDFNDVLAEFNNAFVDWRYVFEREVELHFEEARKLTKVVLDYANELAKQEGVATVSS